MLWDPSYKPRLRPVEAFDVPDPNDPQVGLRDRSGLSDVVVTLSRPALHVLALMDGDHTCEEVRREFHAAFGQVLSTDTLLTMLEHLERAHFLEGPQFETHYQKCLEAYREAGTRDMPHAAQLGITDSSGSLFDAMLADVAAVSMPGRVRGLIAPHLDYARGEPCYALAYGAVSDRPVPDRVVILGTNHFGRSMSVTATCSDFSTPLGTTRSDTAFVERLEQRCGDLRAGELDHLHEHSIELQVAWLQHLFGAESFQLVPLLCPDPCGPTGTAPFDGRGVDLRDFARALGALVDEDDADTLLVAAADLSHVGAAFGEERKLDSAYCSEVRELDHGGLACIENADPEGWLRHFASRGNPTNVCSAGCIFALATALPDAEVTLLGYHQAVDEATQTCVTCSAVAFT